MRFRVISMMFGAVCLIVSPVQAELRTFQFAGVMSNAQFDFGVDFAPGDAFVGKYTFETEAPAFPSLPWETSVVAQYDAVIAWEFSFPSKGYSFSGALGSIAVGNDTEFGDRYIATLVGATSNGVNLPSGRIASYFQMDLQDFGDTGGDLLTDNSIQLSPPDLTKAGWSRGGRFSFENFDQPQLEFTVLQAVPEPTTWGLALLGTTLLAIRQVVACPGFDRRAD